MAFALNALRREFFLVSFFTRFKYRISHFVDLKLLYIHIYIYTYIYITIEREFFPKPCSNLNGVTLVGNRVAPGKFRP